MQQDMAQGNEVVGNENVENATPTLGAVIYTDGGAKPNPGNLGLGAHGYIYENSAPTKGSGLGTHTLTDFGYVPMSVKDIGDKKVVKPIHYLDFVASSDTLGTNNAAEVDALFHVLEKLHEFDLKDIKIFTDSEYLRRGIDEWMRLWVINNWRTGDGQPIKNLDSWKRLNDLLKVTKDKGINFSIKWVKGHSDNFGNNIADKHASIGVNMSMASEKRFHLTVTDASGYWKVDVTKHPFLNFKRLYFNSSRNYNQDGTYYIAEPGGDDYIVGKKMPETSYAVVRLKEKDEVIETVKERQFDISNSVNSVIMMRLDKLYSPEVYPYIHCYGRHALTHTNRGLLNINFVDDKPITVEINPAGLSLRAIECFAHLVELLERFEDKSVEHECWKKTTGFKVHDITSSFFNIEEKKKKDEMFTSYTLKSEIGVGIKDLMVEVSIDHKDAQQNIHVPLVFGSDILPRNNIKRLESLSPKISLITWKESDEVVRYATVVEASDSIGIWSNFYADKIFVK